MAKDTGVIVEVKSDKKEIEKTKTRVIKPLPKTTNPSNPVTNILIALAGIFAILPAMIYGVFTFFGAGFKYGLDAAVKMYGDLMADAKTWAK
jgi:hypothetical protein